MGYWDIIIFYRYSEGEKHTVKARNVEEAIKKARRYTGHSENSEYFWVEYQGKYYAICGTEEAEVFIGRRR